MLEEKLALTVDTILITGAGRGIGKALALALSKFNVHVICLSKSLQAEQTAAEINASGGRASSIVCDLADLKSVQKTVRAAMEQHAVNHLGIILAAGVLGPNEPLYEANISALQETMNINLFGNIAVYQALAPMLWKAKFGRIIFFSGGGSANAFPEFPAYSASKTAIVRTVENMHHELQDKGDFAVVALAPGAIATDMFHTVKQSYAHVKETSEMALPIQFVEKFLAAKHCAFSGCLMHVKDDWQDYLHENAKLPASFKLRREELPR